jgi:formamidopyrimidine-DNA glycosylase
MPEGPEVTILSNYLLTILKGNIIENMEILGGKYLKKNFNNADIFNDEKYMIKKIDTKGKLMWFTLKNLKNNNLIYLTSHLGLVGFWGFKEGKNSRIKFNIKNKNTDIFLYYNDDSNFGNIEIYTEKNIFDKKIDEIATDSLKDNYSISDFVDMYKNYLTKSKRRNNQNITTTLMKQKKSDGILSGIGNYLMAEILYMAKISPFRTLETLTEDEIIKLGEAIQYLTKLSYYNNTSEYMHNIEDHDNYIKLHKKNIDNGVLSNYHDHIKINKNNKFIYKIYRKNKDPDGNNVEIDKTIQINRKTYWVPNIQK